MTPLERSKPELLKATRKRRIASGAGVQVQEVNRLLNQFEQMRDMMKKMKGGGLMKMMKRMGGMKGSRRHALSRAPPPRPEHERRRTPMDPYLHFGDRRWRCAAAAGLVAGAAHRQPARRARRRRRAPRHARRLAARADAHPALVGAARLQHPEARPARLHDPGAGAAGPLPQRSEAQLLRRVDAPARQPVRRLRGLRRHLAGGRGGRGPAAGRPARREAARPARPGRARAEGGEHSGPRLERGAAADDRGGAREDPAAARRPCPPSMASRAAGDGSR